MALEGAKVPEIFRKEWAKDIDVDPAASIKGMPPNFGEYVLPHVSTFQGILAGVSRVYRASDEALKDSFENARFMLNDLAVLECIEQRQRSVALLDWHLEPDDESDHTQQWLCEQLTPIIERIPNFMQFRENLLKAVWFGRYAVKVKFAWNDNVKGKRRLIIPEWLPVHGDKLVFRYDDGSREYDPSQVGLRVGAGYTTYDKTAQHWDEIRKHKVQPTDYGLAYFLDDWERDLLMIHKHQIDDGEYEHPVNAGRIHGLGIRSRIYWTWYQKQEALAWMMEFLERSAFGIDIWYYPWGNKEAEDKCRKAAEERIAGGRNIILVPRPMGDEGQAYGIEHIEPGFAGVELLKDLLQNYFGHLIKRYVLGQTLTSEAEATGLGSNLAAIHLDTFLQIVKYDATNLEETLTRELVDRLKQFNFPKFRDVPIRFKIETESADVESKLAGWQSAYEMGLKLKATDVADLIGAAIPEQDDDVLQNPQIAGSGEEAQAKAKAAQYEMGVKQQAASQKIQLDREAAQADKELAREKQQIEREKMTIESQQKREEMVVAKQQATEDAQWKQQQHQQQRVDAQRQSQFDQENADRAHGLEEQKLQQSSRENTENFVEDQRQQGMVPRSENSSRQLLNRNAAEHYAKQISRGLAFELAYFDDPNVACRCVADHLKVSQDYYEDLIRSGMFPPTERHGTEKYARAYVQGIQQQALKYGSEQPVEHGPEIHVHLPDNPPVEKYIKPDAPNIVVNIPKQDPPKVEVNVNVPAQKAPKVDVKVEVPKSAIKVDISDKKDKPPTQATIKHSDGSTSEVKLK